MTTAEYQALARRILIEESGMYGLDRVAHLMRQPQDAYGYIEPEVNQTFLWQVLQQEAKKMLDSIFAG